MGLYLDSKPPAVLGAACSVYLRSCDPDAVGASSEWQARNLETGLRSQADTLA